MSSAMAASVTMVRTSSQARAVGGSTWLGGPSDICRRFSAIALTDDTDAGLDELAGPGIAVETKEVAYQGSPGFAGETQTMSLIRGFLLAISALIVGAFFTVWTVQRTGEIGVLKALDAAIRLFTQHGVESVSMGTIAEAVGLARPSLYRYFPTKSSIVVRWFDQAMGPLIADSDQIARSDARPTARFDEWVDHQVAFLLDLASRAMIQASLESDDLSDEERNTIGRRHRDLYDSLQAIISDSDATADSQTIRVRVLLIVDLLRGLGELRPRGAAKCRPGRVVACRPPDRRNRSEPDGEVTGHRLAPWKSVVAARPPHGDRDWHRDEGLTTG